MQFLMKHQPNDDPVDGFIQKKCSEGKSCTEAMVAGLNKFLLKLKKASLKFPFKHRNGG
jgi:hypothetical protein